MAEGFPRYLTVGGWTVGTSIAAFAAYFTAAPYFDRQACTPNEVRECPPAGGKRHQQRCRPDGQGFDECELVGECTNGEETECAENGRPGTKKCTNGAWQKCDLHKAPPACKKDEKVECVDATNRRGWKSCRDGQWGDCVANPIPIVTCKEGDKVACPPAVGKKLSKVCKNGKWLDCVEDIEPLKPCEHNKAIMCVTSSKQPGTKRCTNGKWGECVPNVFGGSGGRAQQASPGTAKDGPSRAGSAAQIGAGTAK